MNMHKGARLTPYSRALLVQRVTDQGMRVEEAAHAAGVSSRTAYKWLRRYREEGAIGLVNRSSRPNACPHATTVAKVSEAIGLRRERQTYRMIAHVLALAPSTVGRVLQRAGLNRLAALEPA
jgi:transposase